jgi:hypothetical protein
MNYLVCDSNLLGRYDPGGFRKYPRFFSVGCTSSVLLPSVLGGLERPRVVVVTSLGSMLASSGSMEPPSSRLAALTACIQEVWSALISFSESAPDAQVSVVNDF